MALLRNRGRTEPSGGEWAETGHNSQGKDHSVINYSATLNKQSHVTSQKDRVAGFRLVTDDHQRLHGPPRIYLFKNHGDVVDDHSQFPQSTAYGSPKKAGEFSPKESLHAAHMKNSPISREEDDDDDDSSTDDEDDEDDNYYWQGGYGGPYPPKPVRTRPEHDTDYYSSESPKGAGRKPSLVPPPAARHQQYAAPVSTSPKKDAHRETARNRPIGRSPQRSKPGTDTQSPEAGWKPLFEPTMGRHPQYSAPISTSPKKDETANYRPIRPGPSVHGHLRSKPESQTGYASDPPKAGRHPSFDYPAGRKPHHTFPTPKYAQPPQVKDSQYETAYNSKPAYDNGKGVTFENPKPKYAQPPQVEVGPQPRKEGRQQTINSSEARKRYGGNAVNPPKGEEEEYRGTINSIEAARKYNGVFVP